MQTFLPWPTFKHSAEVLDYRRLGKQRIEALDIYFLVQYKVNPGYFDLHKEIGISEKSAQLMIKRYLNHPAILMWVGYADHLAKYYNVIRGEWMYRGYVNNMPSIEVETTNLFKRPNWLGGKIHSTHRSNLLRKDPKFYSQYGWKVPDNLPYYWPVTGRSYNG